jgi:hypothetical protein
MWHFWKQWQEDAALDSEILKLIKQRKEELITLYCLQWQADRQHLELATTKAYIEKVKARHHALDCELAKIDGRLSVVKLAEKELKGESQVKKILKKMSKADREKFISDLEAMK